MIRAIDAWLQRPLGRCLVCHRIIWPWQHYGMMRLGGGEIRWHSGHRRT